jgi:cytochrome c oxidase assembly protein subunit 15
VGGGARSFPDKIPDSFFSVVCVVSVFPDVDPAKRAIAAWLLACCALVFAMVVVGGITRLTHSGLSIVEWQPIVGAVPPLTDAQWEEAFAKYRETPEFRLRNHDMTVAGFKGIFWWEFAHRLLGRVIGFAFFAPFLYFLFRGRVRGRLGWQLAGIFLLGGLQGAMGWFMVKSGLVDDPRVSQFRLAAHLGLAFLIYGAMLRIALGLWNEGRGTAGAPGMRRLSTTVLVTVFATVLAGAIVAGIRAGYAYNTFPLMNGHVVPPEILMIDPWWMNFGYNMATVQFDHRALAWLLALLVPLTWWTSRAGSDAGGRMWANALLAAFLLQFSLGVATVLTGAHIVPAAFHQAGSLVLFTCAIGLRQAVRARAGSVGDAGTPGATRR